MQRTSQEYVGRGHRQRLLCNGSESWNDTLTRKVHSRFILLLGQCLRSNELPMPPRLAASIAAAHLQSVEPRSLRASLIFDDFCHSSPTVE